MESRKSNILNLTFVALSVAMLAVCSWISIPALGPFVPFTLQTFAVFLIAGLFNWKMSLTSVVVYILLGVVGVPVFSGFKGGLYALLGPTGGYIVGFLFCVLIISLFKYIGKESVLSLVVGMIVGLAVCYAFGTVWFYFVTGQSKGIFAILSLCVFPFLIPDAVKMVLAVILVNRLQIPLKKIGFKPENVKE